MKRAILSQWVSFSVFGLLLVSCPVTFFKNQISHNSSPKLSEIIRGDTCLQGCWQTIEPTVSTVHDVDRLLDTIGVSPYVLQRLEDGSPMTYSWEYSEVALLPDSSQRLRHVLVSFSENGEVIRVIVPVDLCIATMIEEFGLPRQIIKDSVSEFELLYPEEGFFATTKGSRIEDLVKASLDEFPKGESIPPEQLIEMLDPSCTDAFSG